MDSRGHPQSPLGASIDLVLDARGIIDHTAQEEIADEQRRHHEELDWIKARYAEAVLRECTKHREYLRRIESTRARIADLQRQMAAQLSVAGYPHARTPEMLAMAGVGV